MNKIIRNQLTWLIIIVFAIAALILVGSFDAIFTSKKKLPQPIPSGELSSGTNKLPEKIKIESGFDKQVLLQHEDVINVTSGELKDVDIGSSSLEPPVGVSISNTSGETIPAYIPIDKKTPLVQVKAEESGLAVQPQAISEMLLDVESEELNQLEEKRLLREEKFEKGLLEKRDK